MVHMTCLDIKSHLSNMVSDLNSINLVSASSVNDLKSISEQSSENYKNIIFGIRGSQPKVTIMINNNDELNTLFYLINIENQRLPEIRLSNTDLAESFWKEVGHHFIGQYRTWNAWDESDSTDSAKLIAFETQINYLLKEFYPDADIKIECDYDSDDIYFNNVPPNDSPIDLETIYKYFKLDKKSKRSNGLRFKR